MALTDAALAPAECRAQLERILTSHGFSTSRRLSDFLRFVSERAFANGPAPTQEEIADTVLGKGDDFVATWDASVRKLASMTRQRLEAYYEREGRADTILISLPARAYLPVFALREPSPSVEAPKTIAPLEVPPQRSGWLIFSAAAVLALAWVTAGLWWRTATEPEADVLTIQTTFGDVHNRGSDAAPEGVQVGDIVPDTADFTALLDFRPESEAQQAGIMLWINADNYVRLGRRFGSRNYLELGHETAGVNRTPPENFRYDPEGQTGRPLWLSLRREGSSVRAFASSDGTIWTQVGAGVQLPAVPDPVRTAIYGFNGRRRVPTARAVFRHVRLGRNFTIENANAPPFETSGSCPADLTPSSLTGGLSIRLRSRQARCSASVPVLDIPEANAFTVETRVEFQGLAGSSSGLYLAGTKGRVRLVRTNFDSPAVALIHDGHTLVSSADFHGAPPLILRMSAVEGTLRAQFSRDGEEFRAIPADVPLHEIGSKLKAGVVLSTSETSPTPLEPEAHFWFVHRHVGPFRSYR